MFAHLQCRADRGLQISHVIHGIENTKDIDAVDGGAFDELFNDVVCVVAVTQDVLPPKQHLLGRVGHRRLELPDAFPGIFAKVANTGIKGRATPGFHRPESHLIELGRDRQHVFDAHAGRQQALVRIPQYQFG